MRKARSRGTTRRKFLAGGAVLGGGLLAPGWLSRAPFAQTGPRPAIPYGVQSGDVGAHRAVVWSATDRPARMVVEYATTDGFSDARRIVGPAALPEWGFTAKAVRRSAQPAAPPDHRHSAKAGPQIGSGVRSYIPTLSECKT
jgi:alkaline phosphatase D